MTTEPTTQEFRERLVKTIKEKGFNESRLAKKTGISPSTIANYRNGVTQPDKTKLRIICQELGVSVEWMLTGVEDEQMTSEKAPGYKKADQIILSDSGIEAMYSLALEMHGLKDTLKASIKEIVKEVQKEAQNDTAKQYAELKQEIIALRKAIEKQSRG